MGGVKPGGHYQMAYRRLVSGLFSSTLRALFLYLMNSPLTAARMHQWH